jgi:hypothetical protein
LDVRGALSSLPLVEVLFELRRLGIDLCSRPPRGS